MIRVENVLKTYFQDVLKMSWRRFCKTSWRRFEYVLKTSWEDVMKISWKHLEDVLARRMTMANIFVLIKTSWTHLEDVFWRLRQKTSKTCLHQDKCLLGNLLKYSTLHKTHFALRYWQPFFSWFLQPGIQFF